MRTGLSTQLIRKWEERYEAVTPSRFPNGYRGYTKRDTETLLWLKGRVDEGVPIGLAVQEWKQLGAEQSEVTEVGFSPVVAEGVAPLSQTHLTPAEATDYRERLIELFLHLDQSGAQRFFDQLLALHHMDFVLLQVLAPALVEVGERWERGEISEFQEHFGSHFVRERLLAMRNLYHRPSGMPLVVTACSPGERHELGVLFFGYFAMQQGFQIVYLGAAPSEKGILDCLEQKKPAAFAFGTSSLQFLKQAEPFYLQLDARIAELGLTTKVFIGGRVIERDELLRGTRSIHLVSGDAQETIKKIKQLTG